MFDWNTFGQFIFSDVFLQSAWLTLWISVVAQFAGIIIGLFLALMRMSRSPFLSWPARAYIWFFRGSPLLVQVLLLFNGLPKLTNNNPLFVLPAVLCVLVAFSLNEGAYMAEITRAGITSVDLGQLEAAKALGMRYALAMRRIILPQAIRVIIPPLGNEFNNMLKTTSLASVIGLTELAGQAENLGSANFTTFELLIVATFYYLVLTTLWGFFQSLIERRLDPNRTTKYDIKEKKSFAQRTLGIGSWGSEGTLASRR